MLSACQIRGWVPELVSKKNRSGSFDTRPPVFAVIGDHDIGDPLFCTGSRVHAVDAHLDPLPVVNRAALFGVIHVVQKDEVFAVARHELEEARVQRRPDVPGGTLAVEVPIDVLPVILVVRGKSPS